MGKDPQTAIGKRVSDDRKKAAFTSRASQDRVSTARKMGEGQSAAEQGGIGLSQSLFDPEQTG